MLIVHAGGVPPCGPRGFSSLGRRQVHAMDFSNQDEGPSHSIREGRTVRPADLPETAHLLRQSRRCGKKAVCSVGSGRPSRLFRTRRTEWRPSHPSWTVSGLSGSMVSCSSREENRSPHHQQDQSRPQHCSLLSPRVTVFPPRHSTFRAVGLSAVNSTACTASDSPDRPAYSR